MKIVFMGSPEFALGPLNLLLKSEHEVVAVYTRAPKPAGRGKRLAYTPVHLLAIENDVTVKSPSSLKLLEVQEEFYNFAADVAIVVAYGLILPKEIVNFPKYGCINIHPSLLPRWRGAAPIQHSILAGDSETGVSIMQLDEGLDSGPVLAQQKLPILTKDNYQSLHDRLSEVGGNLLIEILNERGTQASLKQDGNCACYADKIKDYQIYASDDCDVAYRKVKAFYPKAFVKIEGKRIRIIDSDFETNKLSYLQRGTVFNDEMHIKLKGGNLMPKIVQMEGRNPCKICEFTRGFKIKGKIID